MQLLGTAPGIVFDRRYPAEYRFLSYFARIAEQMTEPFDELRHLGVTPFFFGSHPAWGPIPFDSDIVGVSGLRQPLLRAMWTAWTERARAENAEARYYAEKIAVPIEVVVAAGIDVQVIDLVRDPRDVLASIRAFTATGVDGFERLRDQSEAEYVDGFIARIADQLARMRDTPSGVDRVTVRYEDLASDLPGTSARLATWLGVALDPDAVLRQRDQYRDHMTSPSVEASIGRYQRDLERHEIERIDVALGPLIKPYGYCP
jgi:hypothetical protein